MSDLTFTAIDVETANPSRTSICQIGLAQVSDGRVGKPISILVNPEEPFGQVQTGIHGIDERAVRNAETLRDIHPRVCELIRGGILVSHSSFDRQALEQATGKYGLEMPQVRWLDSGRIARAAWPERYGRDSWSLKKIADDLGISFQHHEAGGRCQGGSPDRTAGMQRHRPRPGRMAQTGRVRTARCGPELRRDRGGNE